MSESSHLLYDMPISSSEYVSEIWAVRFVGTGASMKLSKEYFYYVPFEKCVSDLKDNFSTIRKDFFTKNPRPGSAMKTFRFVNEMGYDYRKAYVVLSDIIPIDEYEKRSGAIPFNGLRRIDKIEAIFDEYGQTNNLVELDEICKNRKKRLDYMYAKHITDNIQSSTDKIESSMKTLGDRLAEIAESLPYWGVTKAPEYEVRESKRYDKVKFEKEDKINYNNNTIKNEGENNMFEKVFKNFRFGKATGVKMSIYGPAFECGDHTWYAYDEKEMEYVDVTDLCLGIDSFCYAMPIAAADVQVGDFIIHNNGWARVSNFDSAGYVVLEKIYSREIVTVMPTRSAFGFDFYTKLWSPFASLSCTASKEAPFGNMLPFLMMSDSSNKEMLLPLMMMQNGGNMDMSNPFMLMALMGDKNGSNKDAMLPMIMMMQGSNGFAFGKTCKCECDCHHTDKVSD